MKDEEGPRGARASSVYQCGVQWTQPELHAMVAVNTMATVLTRNCNGHLKQQHIRSPVCCARHRCIYRHRSARHAIEAKCETPIHCTMDDC